MLENRYDFVLLVDVKDGNPNGDPDAGNLPRIDAETGLGLITDVCIKRKVRNYVALLKNYEAPYDIYIRERAILNDQNDRAYKALDKEVADKKGYDKVDEARDWMCKNFYDIRTFGAVMALKVNCGQVRGPVQLTFARSVDVVNSQDFTVTRCAVATQQEADKQEGANRTMGRKSIVPYGLYVAHGFVSAKLANQTGFSEDDLNLFWEALENMFENDRSAARGEMCTRGLYIFKHDSEMGNAPAHKLFDLVKVSKVTEEPARSFSDYKVEIEEDKIPQGVTLIKKVG